MADGQSPKVEERSADQIIADLRYIADVARRHNAPMAALDSVEAVISGRFKQRDSCLPSDSERVTALLRQYAPGEAGPDGYPPEWHRSIKAMVRAMAGHRCVRCLHPFPPGSRAAWSPCDERCRHDGPVRSLAGRIEAARRVLTTHHLTGDKLDCRWWNLAALCQRCHLTIQGKVVMDRRWHHDHSDWFKPYVAGYYAARYLGQDIGRAEAERRMDELLALEVRQEPLL